MLSDWQKMTREQINAHPIVVPALKQLRAAKDAAEKVSLDKRSGLRTLADHRLAEARAALEYDRAVMNLKSVVVGTEPAKESQS